MFSEATETTPTKSRIVVEIPASMCRRNYRSQEHKVEPKLEWENLDNPHRTDISIAILEDISNKAAEYTPPSSTEDSEDVQYMLDTQLMSDIAAVGPDAGYLSPTPHGSHTPATLFYKQLHESSLHISPSPVPPVDYTLSSFEAVPVATSSDTVIVDLCDKGDDESKEDFLRILHAHNLTQH